MSIKFFQEFPVQDLGSYTLILPAVSVGNVGQLATDLIISNLKDCKKIGRIFHDALESVVGNDNSCEGGPVSLMTSCEIFQAPEQKLLILQFHSPVLVKQTNNFVNFLVNWIEEKRIKQVICLSSTFASERNDAQLIGPPFRYLTSSATSPVSLDLLSKCGWLKKLESRQFPAPPVISGDDNNSVNNKSGEIYIPGGGITKDLLEICESRSEIGLIALLMFVSEGDNVPDAKLYFQHANELFQWTRLVGGNNIKIPQTWVQLFGPSFPPEIY